MKQLNQTDSLEFITAGKAIFTCKSLKTGNRFTYKVSAPKDAVKETATLLFAQVLSGPDNNSDYRFFGCLLKKDGKWGFATSPKSKISLEAPSVIAFNYVINNLADSREMPQVEIWHEGKCGRCGRKLTTPESLEIGLGPECAQK